MNLQKFRPNKNLASWCFAICCFSVVGLLNTSSEAIGDSTVPASSTAVKARFFDSAGVRPGGKIPQGKLLIKVQSIEFDPRWETEEWRSIDPEYGERIRTAYTVLLKEKLSAGFRGNGFDVVEKPEEATIIVKATIFRFQINSPELEGITPNMEEPAGHAEIHLDLVRRADQQLLARLTSFRRTQSDESEVSQQVTRGRNYHDFGNLMALWARESAIYLSDPKPE